MKQITYTPEQYKTLKEYSISGCFDVKCSECPLGIENQLNGGIRNFCIPIINQAIETNARISAWADFVDICKNEVIRLKTMTLKKLIKGRPPVI